jgi:hypothetical protein
LDDRHADGQMEAGAAGEEKTVGAIGRAASSAGDAFVGHRPDDAHRALSRLETMGRIEVVVTQNYATDTFSQRPLSRGLPSSCGRSERAATGRFDQFGRPSPNDRYWRIALKNSA